MWYRFLVGVLMAIQVQLVPARTVSFPKTVDDLLKQADLVGVVEITAADSEGYETWVYRARVLEPVKGAERGDVIFFGPVQPSQHGERMAFKLWGDYVVFLVKAPRPVEAHRPDAEEVWKTLDPFFHTTNATGGVLPVMVRCDQQGCDRAAGIWASYITPPTDVRQIKDRTEDDLAHDVWLVESELLALLRSLVTTTGDHGN
jgi:hypothetical protein